jgi:hypothetical protein
MSLLRISLITFAFYTTVLGQGHMLTLDEGHTCSILWKKGETALFDDLERPSSSGSDQSYCYDMSKLNSKLNNVRISSFSNLHNFCQVLGHSHYNVEQSIADLKPVRSLFTVSENVCFMQRGQSLKILCCSDSKGFKL